MPIRWAQNFARNLGPLASKTDYGMNGGASTTNARVALVDLEGIWAPGRRIAPRHIIDGLSHTYLLGEKAMDADRYIDGRDFGDRGPWMGWIHTTPRGFISSSYVRYARQPPWIDRPGFCDPTCHDFGSAHPGGWNSALADGSVRSNPFGVDRFVHIALGSIDGRRVAGRRLAFSRRTGILPVSRRGSNSPRARMPALRFGCSLARACLPVARRDSNNSRARMPALRSRKLPGVFPSRLGKIC